MARITAFLWLVRTEACVSPSHPPSRRGDVHPGHLPEPSSGVFVGYLPSACATASDTSHGVVELHAFPVQHPQGGILASGTVVYGSRNRVVL